MDDDGEPTGLPPSEAFDLLGNETRLAIVRELAKHRRTNWRFEGLRFAELRKAVGVDDAGTFSYHLDELRGVFVEQRDEEYVLKHAGLEVADAVLAGSYGVFDARREARTDHPCPDCGADLLATYEDELVALVCEDHGIRMATTLPPGAVEGRSMADVVAIAGLTMHQDIELVRSGACFHCWGPTAASVWVEGPFEHPGTGDPVEVKWGDGERPDGPLVLFGCDRCEMVFWSHPMGVLVRHPAVIAHAHGHGVDLTSALPTRRDVWHDRDCTVESTEPVRIRLDLGIDGDRLSVTLDEGATVVGVERR